jgi:hypothetical protein
LKKNINILALTIEPTTTNKLFKKNYPSLIFLNKTFLREDKNKGMVDFKKNLKMNNINIFTKNEIKKFTKIDYEMHFYSNIPQVTTAKLYLILPEHYYVDKQCKKEILEKKYDKIFTNILNHVDKRKFIYLNWPLYPNHKKIITKKKFFLCMIASNKTLIRYTKNSGYSERSKIINWFVKNKPGKLKVFGKGWNRPIFENYFFSRLTNFLFNKFEIKYNFLKDDYMGTCNDKQKVLKNFKFAFCIENVVSEPGYNTAQIFDIMKASTIPIYLGRKDINKIIPKNCFIDYNNFKNIESLYNFIANMNEKKFSQYQKNIFNFCNKKFPKEFTEKNFRETIVKQIIKSEKN